MQTGSPKPFFTPDGISEAPSAFTVAQVASATSATALVAASAARKRIHIKNLDASIVVYIGNAGVTTTTGFRLVAGEEKIITGPLAALAFYSISASGTPAIQVMSET